MTHSAGRRAMLLATATLPFALYATPSRIPPARREVSSDIPDAISARFYAGLSQLETTFGGRIGVAARHLNVGGELLYRADERFPVTSTFKALLAAAILRRDMDTPGVLTKHIRYTQADLLPHSPITALHLAQGMTVADLCAATVSQSDNAAANLLLRLLGGPPALTAYLRSLSDAHFRLDRWEPELNEAVPGDPRDTTTPLSMMASLEKVMLRDALDDSHRQLLRGWMRATTTGDARIRAAVEEGWQVEDKTGGGRYGTGNDIGLVQAPDAPPIIIAIYTTRVEPDAEARSDIVAQAARITLEQLRDATRRAGLIG